MGVGQATVGRICNGETEDPGVLAIYKIAKHLGVTMESLIDGSPSVSQSVGPDPDTLASAIDTVREIQRNHNFDIGHGTETGAILAAYTAYSAGSSPVGAVSAVMAYAAENGGGYGNGSPLHPGRDRKSS